MGDRTNEKVIKIIHSLKESPKSINQISEEAKIEWRTAESHLKLLEEENVVIENKIKNTRTFSYKDQTTLFKIPIPEEKQNQIKSIYSKIREFCLKEYNKEPFRTHVQKIIWKVNKELNLNLPVAWYRYGPCCVQIYTGVEEYSQLNDEVLSKVEKTTHDYCAKSATELKQDIYKEENKKLYLLKQEILEANDKDVLNYLFMDFLKEVPKNAVNTVTDYARATLLLSFDKTKIYFSDLWKFITMHNYKEGLEEYYGRNLDIYFEEELEPLEEELQITIKELVEEYMKSKWPQERKL